MPPKNKKPNQNDMQLTLPFKEKDSISLRVCEDSSSVINLSLRIKEKSKQNNARMKITKRLMDYANSLDW